MDRQILSLQCQSKHNVLNSPNQEARADRKMKASANSERLNGLQSSRLESESQELDQFLQVLQTSDYAGSKKGQRCDKIDKSTQSKLLNLVAICGEKIKQDRFHSKALTIRANSYMKLGLVEDSLADCDVILKKDSINMAALYLRGTIYLKLQRPLEAIQDLTKVMEFNPGHVNAALARASCYNLIGEFDLAIKDYEAGLLQDQRNNLNQSHRRTNLSTRLTSGSRSERQHLQIDNKENQAATRSTRGSYFPIDVNGDDEFQLPEPDDQSSKDTAQNPEEELEPTIQLSFQQKSMQTFYSNNTRAPSNTNNEPLLQEADRLHKKGYLARKEGRYQEAIQWYTKAIQENPYHFKSYFNRAFAYDKINQFESAIHDYDQAILLENQNPYAYYNKGIALNKIGMFEEAHLNFAKSIELDPTKSDFYHNRGFSLRKMKRYAEAIKDFTLAFQLNPEHFKAIFNRAFCNEKLGRVKESLVDYEQCLLIQPSNQSVAFTIANLKSKIGGEQNIAESIKLLAKILKQDQSNRAVMNALGINFEKVGDYKLALDYFTEACKGSPINMIYLHNRACCLRSMKKYGESLDDFFKVLESDPKNSLVFSNIGLVYRMMEDYQTAANIYSKEIEYNKQSCSAFNKRAFCFAKLGRYEQAIADYTTSISLEKNNNHAFHNRGICFQKLEKFRQAIDDFNAVIFLKKDSSSAYFNRGCCFDAIGDVNQAIADYSTALQIDSMSSKEINQQLSQLSS